MQEQLGSSAGTVADFDKQEELRTTSREAIQWYNIHM